MGELHPIEAEWRRFRNSACIELLRRALGLRQTYLDLIGLKRAPAETALPARVAWSLVAVDEERARGEEAGDRISDEGSLLVNTIHVWAAYRESKTIYEIDSGLAECLARTPWPDATPTAALRLPSKCAVLSIPRDNTTIHLAATYDLVNDDEESGALELRINQFAEDRWSSICILDLREANLAACVQAAAKAPGQYVTILQDQSLIDLANAGVPLEQVAALMGSRPEWRNTTAGLALTLLLYLAGEPDVVRIVHPGERPAVKAKLERADPERFRDLREPRQYSVGSQFRRAIERWEIEHRGDPSVASGKTVRPHMRRAHSHLYWTGKGREIPRVRFLLPISVRGGKLVEEPQHPTETNVR